MPMVTLAGIAITAMALILIFIVLAIASFIFWILMIIDCAKRNFKNPNERVVWIIVLVLLHVLGATIYYFAVKRQNK